jgi:hypothetical protein
MARLHAVTGSQWRRTVRIAGKSAFLARARLSPPEAGRELFDPERIRPRRRQLARAAAVCAHAIYIANVDLVHVENSRFSNTGLKQRFGESRVGLMAYGRTQWS